jgi:methyl-accepting chemotaxis protein
MKNKRTVSIKHKLIAICIVFAIIPLLIVNVISSSISKKALRENSEQFTAELVGQISVNVNAFVNEVEKNVTQFTIGELVQKNLITQYASGNTLERVTATRTIEQSIRYLKTMDKNIKSTVLMLADDKLIGAAEQNERESFLEIKNFESQTGTIWLKGLGENKDDIFFIKNMETLSESDACTVIVTVDPQGFIKNIENIKLLEGANVYITDHNGKMIYNQDPAVLTANEKLWKEIDQAKESGTISTAETLTTYAVLPNGWHIIAEIPVKSLTSQLDASTASIWFLILFVGILAVLIGTVVSRGFSKPIINLMTLMKRAEEGDLTIQITEKGNDEIARLCISFNRMIANMRGLLKDTKMVIAETLDDSKVLHGSTRQSVETFEQLSMSIEGIAEGTTQQAEDAQQSAEVMTALADSMQEVMHQTTSIFTANQGAKEMIQVATSSMELLSTTMASSISAAVQIQDSILELSTLTKNIEDIMKLVDDISEHTNLLALNASIEAARAGEVGKGFAVVAGEVRNLAEQSKNATISVRETIHTIGIKTKDTVSLVKRSNTIFASQEEALTKVHGTFFSIIETLQNMGIDLEQVNGRVQNMSVLKDKMVNKIDNIATVTQESAASTEEVSALSEEQKNVIGNLYDLSNKLTATMENLNTSIQTFKVDFI